MPGQSAPHAPRGALLRPYRLVEIDREGRQMSETFSAPDDDEAMARAARVGRGDLVELWSGRRLIGRWWRDDPPPFRGMLH